MGVFRRGILSPLKGAMNLGSTKGLACLFFALFPSLFAVL